MKPKLTKDQVEQIIRSARAQGKRPDLQGVNLYEVNLAKIDFEAADLSQADLGRANLRQANLNQALLKGANLFEADLREAELKAADLTEVNLHGANLREARLSQANLQNSNLFEANFNQADLSGAYLESADLSGAYLNWANFSQANLKGANLSQTNLKGTNLSHANLDHVNFSRASLTSTNFSNANLNCCSIYGISAWNLNLTGANQLNLIVSPPGDSSIITVDHLEIAHFIELLLYSQKIRHVVDVVGQKIALILGSFMGERQAILNKLQEALRSHHYVPLSFDSANLDGRSLVDTLHSLAYIARFIIADLTAAKNIYPALEQILPKLPAVPVQFLLHSTAREDSILFIYPERYPWVFSPYRYHTLYDLLLSLSDKVITPAEQKAARIEARRLAAVEIEARKKD